MMARQRREGLSERHKKILKVLDDFQNNVGYPPSIREIGNRTNIPSTSMVNYYLKQLEEMGYIERDRNVSRGIRLLKPFSEAGSTAIRNFQDAVKDILQIPVLGRIVASEPVPVPPSDFSYFDPESMVDIASSLLPNHEKSNDLFALEVQGNSMIDAMVFDGDIVVMKPIPTAENGELVAVWLNDRDETTLKYFYLEGGRVRLQPANPNMKPIYIEDPSTVKIQGKVIMVIRQVEEQSKKN
jgi:repressor LexA